MINICHLPHRSLIILTGSDVFKFLNGLTTVCLGSESISKLVYGAFLRPQGKIISDAFFYIRSSTEVWLEIATEQLEPIRKSLNLYRLRADVQIATDNRPVHIAFSEMASDNAIMDPRSQVSANMFLGRIYGDAKDNCSLERWLYVGNGLCLPEFGFDFEADRFYALDVNLDLLGGIDFQKGCYVGQELTSRMKRRGQIKNRLCTLKGLPNEAKGTDLTQMDRTIGTVISQTQDMGLGLIRLDRYQKGEEILSIGQTVKTIWQKWQQQPPHYST